MKKTATFIFKNKVTGKYFSHTDIDSTISINPIIKDVDEVRRAGTMSLTKDINATLDDFIDDAIDLAFKPSVPTFDEKKLFEQVYLPIMVKHDKELGITPVFEMENIDE